MQFAINNESCNMMVNAKILFIIGEGFKVGRTQWIIGTVPLFKIGDIWEALDKYYHVCDIYIYVY